MGEHRHQYEPWRGEGCFDPECPDNPRSRNYTGRRRTTSEIPVVDSRPSDETEKT